MSVFRKMYLAIGAALRPDIVKREWGKHCVKMQNDLNEEHYFERGWYVARGHELCER
jgi:hypothetical protein